MSVINSNDEPGSLSHLSTRLVAQLASFRLSDRQGQPLLAPMFPLNPVKNYGTLPFPIAGTPKPTCEA